MSPEQYEAKARLDVIRAEIVKAVRLGRTDEFPGLLRAEELAVQGLRAAFVPGLESDRIGGYGPDQHTG